MLSHRTAQASDLDALRALIEAAIAQLQRPFLDDTQIASSRVIMGLDTQLIDDGTYVVVEIDGYIAGCGGWSRRATLFGGDHTPGRNGALLAEGFRQVELMSTLAGEPLYRACGYEPVEAVSNDRGGVPVPLLRMRKAL